jgi:hypothetical protein
MNIARFYSVWDWQFMKISWMIKMKWKWPTQHINQPRGQRGHDLFHEMNQELWGEGEE